MKRVIIAIASPGDVQDEREAVHRVFTRWNDKNEHAILHPKMWEFAVPELGRHPQKILNDKIIEASDILIAIFWSKLGTPTPTAASGTVEEIREFIAKKGALRVMLYFCKRPVPVDIDPAELTRLNQFKAEMREKGLFWQYTTVEEFEGNLYHHLDVKVEELLSNETLLPVVPDLRSGERRPASLYDDPKLRAPVDFGTSLASIAHGFSARMKEFQGIDGTGNGSNKYYKLGAHVYSSAAMCLDRFLVYSAAGISGQDLAILERISNRLKRLAANLPDPNIDFREYWDSGSEIAEDLLAHVAHIERRRAR